MRSSLNDFAMKSTVSMYRHKKMKHVPRSHTIEFVCAVPLTSGAAITPRSPVSRRVHFLQKRRMLEVSELFTLR